MSTNPSASAPSEAMRQAWHKASVRPLWENPLAHNARTGGPPAHLWAWSELEPLVKAAMAMTSMSVIERRVLTLVDPAAEGHAAGTTTNLTAALQILMPGESARPHRHSMNALRFVLDGAGAVTRVDGRDCPMAAGDLVITPGWSWHEHAHHGSAPIVWLDALDAPLHRHLGTDAFEPGPRTTCRPMRTGRLRDASIVPELAEPPPPIAGVSLSLGEAARAVAAAPKGKDGARRVRHVNPLTGGRRVAARLLPDADRPGRRDDAVPHHRQRCRRRCRGPRHQPDRRNDLRWGPKDVFSMPHGNWIAHAPRAGRPACSW